MLSCSSTEADMMYDHYAAIQGLNYVHVHFPLEYSAFESSKESIFILLRKYDDDPKWDYFFICL